MGKAFEPAVEIAAEPSQRRIERHRVRKGGDSMRLLKQRSLVVLTVALPLASLPACRLVPEDRERVSTPVQTIPVPQSAPVGGPVSAPSPPLANYEAA